MISGNNLPSQHHVLWNIILFFVKEQGSLVTTSAREFSCVRLRSRLEGDEQVLSLNECLRRKTESLRTTIGEGTM